MRDWFAGQALHVLLAVATEADFDDLKTAKERADRYARASYELADAMIAAREGKP